MNKAENNDLKYRCPHCFSIIGKKDYHMVCTDKNCLVVNGITEVDIERSTTFGIDPSSPDAKDAFHHIVRSGNVCDICGRTLKIRVCPRCHHAIPPGAIDDFRNTIVVMGPLNGGLSHYIVSLVRQMGRILEVEFNGKGHIHAADEEIRGRMRENYESRINMCMTIPHSKSPSEPMVYYLSLNTDDKIVNITLIFIDVASDDNGMPKLDHGSDIEGMISEASGIILLIDPDTESEMHYSLGILSHLTDLLKSSRYVDRNGHIDVPLAVTMTKCDLLMDGDKPLLGRPSTIHIKRPCGSVRNPHIPQIDAEVREIVRRGNGNELLDLAESYSQNMFFAVSAIGYNPDNGTLPHGIVPFRVEDPLLWLIERRMIS